ncbi:unnamed protein product, partial [marine sediment metagenome]
SQTKALEIISAGLGFLVLYFVYTFFWSFDLNIYGVPAPEILHWLHFVSIGYIYFLVYPIISMAWLLYSMIASVSGIRITELKIAITVPILRDPTGLGKDEFMSYNEFRERIVLVGQFLYGITLRITAIFVLLVMADFLRNWFHGYDWGVERFIIGGIFVFLTSIVVYISQIGLHSTLRKSKDEFIVAIHERKFKIDLEIQRELVLEIQRDEERERQRKLNLKKQRKSDCPSTEVISSHSSARFEAVSRLDNILTEIESTSTWAINSVNAAQVFSVSLIPLLASILPLIVERLYFG